MIPNASCNENYTCNWDLLASFLDSRLYKKDLHDICFSHLSYGNDVYIIDGNMPWWLAIIIAVPLVIVTIIIIKCILNIRERKRQYI